MQGRCPWSSKGEKAAVRDGMVPYMLSGMLQHAASGLNRPYTEAASG